tara:strand:- start:327 stop:707 length:381 start_codon:yes stop_codon:yes gene_type:complete
MPNYLFDLPDDIQFMIFKMIHAYSLIQCLFEMKQTHIYTVHKYGMPKISVRKIKRKISDLDLFKKERSLMGKSHIFVKYNIWPNIDYTIFYYDRTKVTYSINPESGQLEITYTPSGYILNKVDLQN